MQYFVIVCKKNRQIYILNEALHIKKCTVNVFTTLYNCNNCIQYLKQHFYIPVIKYQLHIHNTNIVQSEHIKYWIQCSDWSCYQVRVQKIVLKSFYDH